MKLFFRHLLVLLLLIGICPVTQAENNVVLSQDLEYINCDLQDVIRDLAELGGFRVILDRQVQGEVSLTLMRGITAKEAIGTVARGYGYSSRWLNASALMIGTSAFINGNFAARSTRIHTLKNADPILVAEKLQTIIPEERIKINHETKELTITADIAEHQNVSDLIKRLDYSNSQLSLDIQVVELADALWKQLRLEMDLRTIELGAITLNADQQRLLQGDPDQLLLGKSDLTCFNYQEAKLLLGDYLVKPAQLSNEKGKQVSVESLETGTQLILTPSLLSADKLQLRLNISVKAIANHQQTLLRGIHSIIGMNIGETILFNGVLQRNEYFNLKQTTAGYQYPILENLFQRKISSDTGQTNRIILLITPRLADGNEQVNDEQLDSPDNARENVIDNIQSLSPVPVGDNIGLDPNLATSPEEEKPVVIFDAVVVPESQPDRSSNTLVRVKGDSYEIKYLVKKGDTPIGIARKYGVELSTILTRNNLTNSDVIKVNSFLIIPIPADRIYVVKPKETLWRIAKRYGITIELLMDLNGIEDQTKVNNGQALILPMSNRNVINPQF